MEAGAVEVRDCRRCQGVEYYALGSLTGTTRELPYAWIGIEWRCTACETSIDADEIEE